MRLIPVACLLALVFAACSSPTNASCGDVAVAPDQSVAADLAPAGADASVDGGTGMLCSVDGNPGQCLDATACAALPSFSAVAGHCPGPANLRCCVLTPDVANNPPVPSGWMLMQQSQVTPDMTSWAVAILNDPTDYPMFSTALRTFGSLTVMARVEWHPPDFQNSVVHRGVTLYVP